MELHTLPATMRAIVHDMYGDADVLVERTIPVPDPAADRVLVRVHAAGVDRAAWHLMRGLPYPVRLAYGLRRPKTGRVGVEYAGVVARVGADVTGLSVGDRVFGEALGAFAEYVVADPAKVGRMSPSLTFSAAAALAVSGVTALEALRAVGGVGAGSRVLVIGASGGVGSVAVQLAVAAGATVTGVSSAGKADLVRSLGAHEVIPYDTAASDLGAGPYDVILDTGGCTALARLRRVLATSGRLVIVGGEGPGRMLGGLERQLGASLVSPFTRQKLGTVFSVSSTANLEALAALVEEGTVRAVVERHYPLVEAAAAMEHLAAGRARGKVVLEVVAG